MYKCKETQTKRYFLPLSAIFLILSMEDVQTFIYIPIVVSFGSFIIFWNFPILAYYNNTKPLYVKDLFVDSDKLPNYDVNQKIKRKFLNIFEWSLIISASILTGALADFWLYKTNGNETLFEMVGITGGILKIFQMVDGVIGYIILKILQRYIIKETTQLKKRRWSNLKRIIQLKINRNRLNESIMIASKSAENLSSLASMDGNKVSIKIQLEKMSSTAREEKQFTNQGSNSGGKSCVVM